MKFLRIIIIMVASLTLMFNGHIALATNTYTTNLLKTSSQYWTRADTASLSITGDITIEAWARITTAPADGIFYAILGKWGYNTSNRSYVMYYTRVGADMKIQVQISQNGINESVKTWNVDLGTAIWQHIAFVYTVSTHIGELYFNGTSQGTIDFGATYTALYDSTALLAIGREEDGATHYYNGDLDDVRVWNAARTATQISNNRSCSLAGTETNLQAYWRFDNDGNDSTANANNLTNNNSATFQSASLPFTNTCGEEYTIIFD